MFPARDLELIDLLHTAVDQAFNAVVVTDANLDAGGPLIEFCNPAFCRMTGYSREELIGRSPRILQGPDTDPEVIDRLRSCLHQGQHFHGSTINYQKDGTPYHVEWNISPVRTRAGAISHFVSVQRNISAKLAAEKTRDLLARALNVGGDPIMITDTLGLIEFVNRSFEELTGYESREILGETPALLHSGKHAEDFYQNLWQTLGDGERFRATFQNRRKDGSLYYVDQSIRPLHDAAGRISHFVSISTDVTGLMKENRELSEKAQRDSLTGLLNRGSGNRLLQELVDRAQARHESFCILLGDIDHFKQINDTHGHQVGDRVLRSLAALMTRAVRGRDHLIRWGGEEFALILPDSSFGGALRLAERIQKKMAQWQDDTVGTVTMSWGLATSRFGETATELMERADQLMYAAKEHGRNRIETDRAAKNAD